MSQGPNKKLKKSKKPRGSTTQRSQCQPPPPSSAPSRMQNVTTQGTQGIIDKSRKRIRVSRKAKKPSKRATTRASSRETTKEMTREVSRDDSSKEAKKLSVAMIETCDGKKLTVINHLRNPASHADFLVKDQTDPKQFYMLRFEPSNKGKLKFLNEILTETKRAVGEEKKIHFVQSFEYGTHVGLGLNYLVLTPFGIQMGEVQKVVRKFTPGCVLNVALQSLEALRYMHKAGYIHRNVKPASFSIGYGENETRVVLSDYRLSRAHIDPSTKAPRKARKTVPYCGTSRYASISCLRELEQGRKDDVESWMYMLYDMFDAVNGLSWRRMPRCGMMINEKENFKKHVLPLTYKVIPEEFKKIVDLIHSWNYESTPDYDALKEIIESVAKAKQYDVTICDWTGKITPDIQAAAIRVALLRSTGNVCSGKDDFENKKKPSRKIMNPDDTIKNGQFTWKVVNLLGSGGFGDVYKVYDERNKNKCYALKTESEDGKKVMLRLKVEMQVLMAIQETRKTRPLTHFVEFVDRGKSEDLRCKFIVMSLVGPSLDDCRKKYGVSLNSKQTPFIVSIQSLEAVRDLHSLGYIHRDIKPANFAVGFGPEEPSVFMLDFGIGRSYLDPKTKEHRAPRKSVKFLGTLRYASRACMKGVDQGRKDDLECWIYMVFDIFDPEDGICWKDVRGRDEITQVKDNFFEKRSGRAFDKVPSGLKAIVQYVNGLQFQSGPDYQYLINKLLSSAEKSGFPINNMRGGGWVGKLKVKKTCRFDDSDSESDRVSGSEDDD